MPAMHSILGSFVDDEAGTRAGPNGAPLSVALYRSRGERSGAAGTNLSATFSAIESALPLTIEVQQTRVEA